jgi:hypothetical protein
MTCLVPLFEPICQQLEGQLKPYLAGLTGPLVRGYLPQRWVFITEKETVTLGVDPNGHAWIKPGPTDGPDVTIETSHLRLSRTLETRDRSQIPPGPYTRTAHTSKGQVAYQLLARRLGLADP